VRLLIAGLFLTAPLWLCSAADGDSAVSAQAIPLCAVLADAAKYDGKEITIRRLYRIVIHGSILMGPDCSRVGVNLRRTSDWKGNKKAAATVRSLTKKDQFREVDIVSRGVFKIAHEGQCFGQNCLPYEFAESELLSAMAAGAKGP
jgi:hypothetical protein